jgi:putative intracellular protease/amidase
VIKTIDYNSGGKMKKVFILGITVLSFFGLNCSSWAENKKNVLMVLTSYDGKGTSHETGYWGEEFVIPYKIFTSAGFTITIASPKGGIPPLDKGSVNPEIEKFLSEMEEPLAQSPKLAEVNPEDFDAVFIVGGHGVIWDLVADQDLKRIVLDLDQKKKIIAAVCHGPAALVKIKDTQSNFLLKGHRVTGFSLAEEQQVKLVEYVQGSTLGGQLEDLLREASGGMYKSKKPWSAYVRVDGNIITGQNPQSSAVTAKAVVKKLLKK